MYQDSGGEQATIEHFITVNTANGDINPGVGVRLNNTTGLASNNAGNLAGVAYKTQSNSAYDRNDQISVVMEGSVYVRLTATPGTIVKGTKIYVNANGLGQATSTPAGLYLGIALTPPINGFQGISVAAVKLTRVGGD